MPHETARRRSEGHQLAAMLLRTAREALDAGPVELASVAGCAPELIRRIESGALDPTMDTVERILNGSGLELRAGPGTASDLYSAPRPDADEVARVRSALAAAQAFRTELGAPAPGPPPRALPDWDGEDPAPGRPFGAAEGRTDGGGWAAVLVRSAIAEARSDPDAFAQACGTDTTTLERIQSGDQRPPAGELASMLAAAGVGLNVRLEVYDDHDDGLHLSALSHPERHRQRMQRAREIFAGG